MTVKALLVTPRPPARTRPPAMDLGSPRASPRTIGYGTEAGLPSRNLRRQDLVTPKRDIPSTPSYLYPTPRSAMMRREMEELVYQSSPRYPQPDERGLAVQTLTVKSPRTARFKNCPWVGDASTPKPRPGSKFDTRPGEFDINKDMTEIPIKQLPYYLKTFNRPTTHHAILQRVEAAIMIQAQMRRLKAKAQVARRTRAAAAAVHESSSPRRVPASARYASAGPTSSPRMQAPASARVVPAAALPAHARRAPTTPAWAASPAPSRTPLVIAPDVVDKAAVVIQSQVRRLMAEAKRAGIEARLGRVDEGLSNFRNKSHKVHDAAYRRAYDPGQTGPFGQKRQRAIIYEELLMSAQRFEKQSPITSADKFKAVIHSARHKQAQEKLPAAGGSSGCKVTLAAERALRLATPRVAPPMPSWMCESNLGDQERRPPHIYMQ